MTKTRQGILHGQTNSSSTITSLLSHPFVPVTGAMQFAGFKVVWVNRKDVEVGKVTQFIVNEGNTSEEISNPDSFNKPIDIKSRRNFMLIVDFGMFEPGLKLEEPGTGKIWTVSPKGWSSNTLDFPAMR